MIQEDITTQSYCSLITSHRRPIHIKKEEVYYHSNDEFTLTSDKQPYIVEKVVLLSHADFLAFANNQMMEWEFIADTFIDSEGCYHGLLVLGDGWQGGYILDSAGTNCAAYCAFVPHARQLLADLYPTMNFENTQEETLKMDYTQSM